MSAKKLTLANGLSVLLIPSAQDQLSSILYLSAAGTRFEDSSSNGLTRFCALMSLKKTRDFPTQLLLADAIDRIGALVNFEINKEYTAFYAKFVSDYFDPALQILSQVIIHPLFDFDDLSREKSYFNAEIQRRSADPNSLAFDELYKLVYGDHPIGYSGIGDSRAVSMFDLNKLNQFKNNSYSVENSLLVICANIKDIEKKIDTAFAELPHSDKLVIEPISLGQKNGEVKSIKIPGNQSTIALGYPAYSRKADQKYAQLLIDVILGKTKSNTRLGTIFREEALASSIRTNVYQYSDVGLFLIQLLTSKELSQPAYNRVLEEIGKLTSSPVSQDELSKIKSYYYGTLLLSLTDPVEKAFFYGLQAMLEDNTLSEDQFFQKLNSVTPEHIQQLAAEILTEDKLSAVMVSP